MVIFAGLLQLAHRDPLLLMGLRHKSMPRNGASEITKEREKLRSRNTYREVDCYVPQTNLVMERFPGQKAKPPLKTDICG